MAVAGSGARLRKLERGAQKDGRDGWLGGRLPAWLGESTRSDGWSARLEVACGDNGARYSRFRSRAAPARGEARGAREGGVPTLERATTTRESLDVGSNACWSDGQQM